jgi:hypothetical protein
MARNVTGFYHDPPLFLREVPFDAVSRHVLFDRFTLEVMRTPLAQGIVMNAAVQGMFAFDFSAAVDHGLGAEPVDHDDFEAWAQSVVARANVMNAYLAFFYTRLIMLDQRVVERMVVTPELTIPMQDISSFAGVMTSNAHVSHLIMSAFPATYIIGLPIDGDRRLLGRCESPAVSSNCLGAAAADLSRLVEEYGVEGIVIMDLFLRATRAYQDHNHSLSLISYWTIVERLINRLWQQMQSENESRDGAQFIDGRRRKTLNDTRTFTAAVMCEMLSFQGILNRDLYEAISTIRRSRNKWMHNLTAVSSEDSWTANSICERLLKQVMDVTVIGAVERRLHG